MNRKIERPTRIESARTMFRDSVCPRTRLSMADTRLRTIAKKMSSTSHFAPDMGATPSIALPEYIPVLNFSRFRFAPRLGPTLLAASAIALFVVLGNWQLGRAR